jgi:hypothetical protein
MESLDETSAESTILCSFCDSLIPSTSLFCAHCGNATFKDSIVFSKSTAEYFPDNPEFKPWKEKPLVPIRKYNVSNSTTQPWYPTMRQKTRPKYRTVVKTVLKTDESKARSPSGSIYSVNSDINSLSLKEDGSIRSVSEVDDGS